MERFLITLLFSLTAATNGLGQVTLFPPYVFADSQTRFGSYRVINDSNTPKEVSISFRFSYGASDSTGNIRAITNDSTKEAKFSIVPWVRAFPQKFILEPNKSQTVRFRVTAPDSLSDGMYWARVITTSEKLGKKTNRHSDTQIHYRFRQINGIYYKAGDIHTGIKIPKLEASVDSSGTLWVVSNVARTGNALFLGTIYATVYNRAHKKVAQSKIVGAVYFNRLIKRPIDVSNLPPGIYTVELRFETQRDDVPTKLLPQMLPVTDTIPFIIE